MDGEIVIRDAIEVCLGEALSDRVVVWVLSRLVVASEGI